MRSAERMPQRSKLLEERGGLTQHCDGPRLEQEGLVLGALLEQNAVGVGWPDLVVDAEAFAERHREEGSPAVTERGPTTSTTPGKSAAEQLSLGFAARRGAPVLVKA